MTESFELGEKCGRFNKFGTGSMHLGLRFRFNEGVQFTYTLFSKKCSPQSVNEPQKM